MTWAFWGWWGYQNYNTEQLNVDANSLNVASSCDVEAIVIEWGVLKKKNLNDCGWGWGGSFSCADVASCIGSNSTVQSSLNNYIEWANFVLTGTWNFSAATVSGIGSWGSFTCTDVANCINSDAGVQNNLLSWLNDADPTLTGSWDFTGATVTGLSGWGGSFDCSDVATCISGHAGTQSNLLSWLNGSSPTLTGSWDFTGATVTWISWGGWGSFDCTDVANCINTNATVQANITSHIEGEDMTFTGALDFTGATLTGITSFDCSDVADCIANNATVRTNINTMINTLDRTITGEITFSDRVTFNSNVDMSWAVRQDVVEAYVENEELTSSAWLVSGSPVVYTYSHWFAAAPVLIKCTAMITKGGSSIGAPDYEGITSVGAWTGSEKNIWLENDGWTMEAESWSGELFQASIDGGKIWAEVTSFSNVNFEITVYSNSANTFSWRLALLIEAIW